MCQKWNRKSFSSFVIFSALWENDKYKDSIVEYSDNNVYILDSYLVWRV